MCYMRISKDLEQDMSPSEAVSPDFCGEAASFDGGRPEKWSREQTEESLAWFDEYIDNYF